jgi:acetyl-CoA decarbonylase/synthase complex subunit delta
MSKIEIPIEKWTGRIQEVKIGGNGRRSIVIGGANSLPFLKFEGNIPYKPAVALEIQDKKPTNWSSLLLSAWGDAVNDTGSWAREATEFGADIIVLKLRSAHPEEGNTGIDEAKRATDKVLSATDLPVIILGPEVAEKDNEVLPAVSEVARGQRIALGCCLEKNYRTIAAVCVSDGQVAIAKSPIDVNLAKQLNIMVSDIGVPLDSILMDPTTGALGYGLEYSYSVMERLRLAALMGDKMTAMPMICTVGEESWRQKESLASEGVPPSWGNFEERALLWEELTASTLLHSGADIVVLRHPKSLETIKGLIGNLMIEGR